MISYSVAFTVSAARGSGASACRVPYCLTRAGSPARKCRSEPSRSRTWVKYLSMAGTTSGPRGFRDRCAGHIGHEALELAFIRCVRVGVFRINFFGGDGGKQRLIHELHPIFLAHLQLAGNLV